MKKLILTLLLAGYIENCNAQLFSFGSGTGVPTETAMGGLLGALIAPMISNGSDAKLVGALLGASALNAAGTMRVNQHQQQMAYQPRYVQQPVQQNIQSLVQPPSQQKPTKILTKTIVSPSTSK